MSRTSSADRDLVLLPMTAAWDEHELAIGGVRCTDIARAHGTPVYVYDAATILHQAHGIGESLRAAYPTASVSYASKALSAPWLYDLLNDSVTWFDVVSPGEIAAAIAGNIHPSRLVCHEG